MKPQTTPTPIKIWEEDKRIISAELLELLKEAESIEQFSEKYIHFFNDISVKEYLENIMITRELEKSVVIKASQISETYAYQIFAGIKKNPSRDKVLSLAIAMRLDFEECQKLLKLAGLSTLYVKNRRDAIIIFGLNNGLSVPQINDILFDLEEFTL